MSFATTGDFYTVFPDSGITKNPLTTHPVIRSVAEQYNISPHTLLYNWAAERGTLVISCSQQETHMRENLEAVRGRFLKTEDMEKLNELYLGGRHVGWGDWYPDY